MRVIMEKGSVMFKQKYGFVFSFNKPQYLAYDDDDPAVAAEAAAAAAAAAAEAEAKAKAEAEARANEDKPTLSQKQLNAIIAKEKAGWNKKIQDQVKQLENAQKEKGLTDKEQERLQRQIDELNNTLLTKEELTKKEREKIQNQHKADLDKERQEKDTWKSNYTREKIAREILDAAKSNEAFDDEQIVGLLSPNTRLVEEVDSESKPTGNWVPKVRFKDVDTEGKPITLELSPLEAVKRMKELPRFGNLFKSGATGGIGGTRAAQESGTKDLAKMGSEEYRKHRKSIGLGPKNRRS